MTSRWTALAAMAALVGFAWLNLNWIETPLDLSPLAPPAAAPSKPLQSASDAPNREALADSQAELSESLSRPLFHVSRRPFVPASPEQEEAQAPVEEVEEVVEQTEPPPALPELRLAGVSASGERKRALIGEADGPDLHWLALGDSIAGWRVDAITASTVVLTSGDQRVTVALYSTSEDGLP